MDGTGMGAAGRTLRGRLADMSPGVQLVVVTCLLLLVYLPTASTAVEGQTNDTFATALPAMRYARHGDLTLDEHAGAVTWLVEARGRLVSNRFPGTVFYAVPFYWILDGDPAAPPTLVPAAVAAALAAALAMGLLGLILRRQLAPGGAAGVALLCGLATSTWAVSANALWSHGPGQLLLAGAMIAMSAGHLTVAGLLLGAEVLVRPHAALIAAGLGAGLALSRRRLRPLLVIGSTASVGAAAYVVYNLTVFGTGDGGGTGAALVTGGYRTAWTEALVHQPPTELLSNIGGTLFAPSRGVLTLSPFLLLLIPGIPRAWRDSPDWVRALTVGGLAYLLFQLRTHPFDGGSGFVVYRLPLEVLTVSAPLLAAAYRQWTVRHSWRRTAFWTLAGVAVGIQALAATVSGATVPEGHTGWRWVEWTSVAERVGPSLVVAPAVLAAAGAWWARRTWSAPPPEEDVSVRAARGDGAP